HEHNERSRIDDVLTRLSAGDTIALVTDAGTPIVSDPGRRLVAAALEADIAVSPIPGPSAVVSALSAAGLEADRFFFAGYPPRRGRERRTWLGSVVTSPSTTVVFEAPGRLVATLEALVAAGAGERTAVVCRELTKIHEEVRRGTIAELATVYGGREVKGEVTLVIEASPEPEGPGPDLAVVAEAARDLARDGVSRRDIADRLTREFGLSRNDAYRASLGDEGAPADE
ncbi:MAG: rRNA small subunit methyltransferase 1, partial [Gemmatimonadetes bacterium]|nr:rRNA small subunit methyltransferase 1 [Gemmatimonadota bacterium]